MGPTAEMNFVIHYRHGRNEYGGPFTVLVLLKLKLIELHSVSILTATDLCAFYRKNVCCVHPILAYIIKRLFYYLSISHNLST